MPVPTYTHPRPERIIPVEVTSRPSVEDFSDGGWKTTKPPLPVYTTRFEDGKYIVGVEAYLNSDGSSATTNGSTPPTMFSASSPTSSAASSPRLRKTSLPANLSSGYHRSRDRTRVSAVQRLVERKLAQKEKERERERDRSLGANASCGSSSSSCCFSSRQSFRASSPVSGRRPPRDLSGSRSENGFMLGAGRAASPSKENIDPAAEFSFFGCGPRPRSARSVSGTRLGGRIDDEPIAKTYITIGPGKPTRIREHSPAKSAKLSPEETVTSARERSAAAAAAAAAIHRRSVSPLGHFDLNRRSSPSPQRKTSLNLSSSSSCSSSNGNSVNNNNNSTAGNKARDVLRTASPLKSTNILKTFRAFKSESPISSADTQPTDNLRLFQPEARFPANQEQQRRQQQQQQHQQRLFSTGNRRLSVDILNTVNRNNNTSSNNNSSVGERDSNNNQGSCSNKNNSDSPADSKRGSPDSERPFSEVASSVFSTPFRKGYRIWCIVVMPTLRYFTIETLRFYAFVNKKNLTNVYFSL
jgi:hypothetical protein